VTAADLFQRGNDAVASADYPAAVAAFQQSLALDPKNPRTLSNLGTALYLGGEPDKAESVFRQAITLEPAYARAHLNLGSALYALNRLDDAHQEIQRAIDLDPTNVDARHNLAALLVEQRRWSEALRVLEAALAIAPKDERLLRQRDQVRAQLDVRLAQPASAPTEEKPETPGSPETATSPETPTSPEAEPTSGGGPCTEATSQAARARFAAKLLAEGRAAYERQELAAAEVALERALDCDPASTAILNHIGAVHMARHDYSRAEAAFRHALSLEPDQFEATINLALAVFEGGRCEEALTLLQGASHAHPESGEGAFQLARVLHRCGHPEEAGVELARADKLLPGDPRVARLKERLAGTTAPP
jgi:tetratricopeptide (TPR) repeat protein